MPFTRLLHTFIYEQQSFPPARPPAAAQKDDPPLNEAESLQTVNEKLISRASLDKMWQDHSGAGYGYGFQLEQTPGGKVAGHGGGFPGLNSQLDILPDKGYIIAVMSNYDSGAEPLRNYVRSLIFTRLKS